MAAHNASQWRATGCHNSVVVFRRLRISTRDSQPITAGPSAGCGGLLHAKSTLNPGQNHGNRKIGLDLPKRMCASHSDGRGHVLARREKWWTEARDCFGLASEGPQ